MSKRLPPWGPLFCARSDFSCPSVRILAQPAHRQTGPSSCAESYLQLPTCAVCADGVGARRRSEDPVQHEALSSEALRAAQTSTQARTLAPALAASGFFDTCFGMASSGAAAARFRLQRQRSPQSKAARTSTATTKMDAETITTAGHRPSRDLTPRPWLSATHSTGPE
mmetsp:Transcript_38919/g.52858  ORF Transcript_38919/g.52858 Transcript_38919/m.52858 type:complete len:168 (-) Transcript_38919:433-936(-)